MSTSTHDRIEHAALDSFAEIGYHATSMRTLANTASVGAASLYHWYSSKEGLLVSIMRKFLVGLHQEVLAAIEEHSGPRERLSAGVRAHVIYHGLHRRAAFVTDTEVRALTGSQRDEILALRDDYERLFLQLVRDGVRDGVFRSTNPRVTVRAILLACTGVAVWFRPSGELSLLEVAELHVEFVVNALDGRAVPPPVPSAGA